MINRNQTNEIKGIAVILLMIHHLLSRYQNDNFFMNDIVSLSKVCVALFVFLSGYGLAKNHTKIEMTFRSFFIKRILKIMIPYQKVFIIFVSVGVYFNLQPLEQSYGKHKILKLILEFLGLNEFIYGHGYNPTWWFIGLIGLLYILFIPLFKFVKKYSHRAIVYIYISSFFISKFFIIIGLGRISDITYSFSYVVVFSTGIYFSMLGFQVLNSTKIKYHQNLGLLFFSFIILSIIRNRINYIGEIKLDFIYSTIIILIYLEASRKFNFIFIKMIFREFGKCSFEIFLTHTFIFFLYFEDITYYFNNKLLILIQGIILGYALGYLVNKILNVKLIGSQNN